MTEKNRDRVGTMFEQIQLKELDDYFIPYSQRAVKGVYVCRLASYNGQIHHFICNYMKAALLSGVCISQKIENPDERQLNYYEEIMGREYQLNPNFFMTALKKWLPRIKEKERAVIADCFYDIFLELARNGKNENMQKNAYIKFMCWLYYKFEPILQQFGKDNLPKLLFEGYFSKYELMMMQILSKTGCDVLILEYQGEEKYLAVDQFSKYSQLIFIEGEAFPKDYSILQIRKQIVNQVREPELKQFAVPKAIKTNVWILGEPYSCLLKEQRQRGEDTSCYYNSFIGIYGAEDTTSYYPELLKWKLKLESTKRKLFLAEDILPPTFDEVNQIVRKNYSSAASLLNDMAMQITSPDEIFTSYCRQAFLSVMTEEKDKLPIQKLLNQAIIFICWLKRYIKEVTLTDNNIPIFLFYGNLSGNNEFLFMKMLASIPMDVVHITPDLSEIPERTDHLFLIKKYPVSLKREKFPSDVSGIQFGTVAYQAEQELNTILYQDTGIYRNHQFKRAIPIPLQIMYEEIKILWKQEAKYRPNFETFDDRVMVPVIFSKVSGVSGKINEYWEMIRDFIGENTFLIKSLPYFTKDENSIFREKAPFFFQNGTLNIRRIKEYKSYPFSFIRDNMQDYMLQKLQELIDSRIIRGTGVNGVEYTIISTVFQMDKKLLRLIQEYDFTKDIPKLVVIHTKETNPTVEDSILLAYLNKIGFDIVLFVPTGYLSVERFYTSQILLEHQAGEYEFDLQVPNLESIGQKKGGLVSRFFKRGR